MSAGIDSRSGAVECAVAQARRRLVSQLGMREGLAAAAISLAGPALLLTFGTDFFPAALLALFVAGGLVWGVYNWRRLQPSAYGVAQVLDRRWRSEDQISTAYYVSTQGLDSESAKAQRRMAEQALRHGDVPAAFPFEWPRQGWAAAAMLAVSAGLLILRLSVQPTLSFAPPLAPLLFPSLAQTAKMTSEEEELLARAAAVEPTSLSEQGELETEARPPSEPEDQLTVPVGGDQPTAEEDGFEMPEVEGLSTGEDSGDELTPEHEGSADGEGDPESDAGGEEQAQNDPEGEWNEESNSLLDRLKDAFKDMLESMNVDPPESASGEPQTGEGQEGSESSGEQGEGEQAEAEAAGGQAGEAEMEGGEQGESSSEQTAQGQGGSDSEQASDQGESSSASGSGDGEKELAAKAEQEAALDALEEFYMQRAEELRGDIMVETVESEQTAQTPYQSVSGAHADRGGVVSRDEIPLAYQQYIQNYFRNLREKGPN